MSPILSTCPIRVICLNFMSLIISGEKLKLRICLIRSFSQPSHTYFPLKF
jgi:hypothetical protein